MGHKTKGLRIATRCTTMDQFVAAFHRFCDAQTVFISTLNPRSVGLETAFSIDLADHTPALRGVGVVLQSWATPQNPYGRPGLQLGVRRLTADSEPVFDRLLFAREATSATPTATAKIMPVFVAKPGVKRPLASTQQMPMGAPKPASTPPPAPDLEPDTRADTHPGEAIGSPLPDDARTPGSDLVLPANPLMNISDHSLEGFVDCTLYEETGNFFGEQPVIEDPEDPVAAPPLLAPRRMTTPPQPAMIVSRPPDDAIPSIPSLAKAPVAQAIGTKPLPIINKLTPPMGASPMTPVEFSPPGLTNREVPTKTLELANDIAGRMTPPPLEPPPQGPPPIPGKPWVSPETAELLDIEPDPPSVAQPMPTAPQGEYPSFNAATHASERYDAVPAPPPYAPVAQAFPAPPYRTPNDHRRRWVIGATAGATMLIAIALLAAGHSKPKAAAVATPPAPAAAPKLLAANTEHARLAPPIPDKPVVDATSSEPEPESEGTSGVVGKGPCKVAVSTTPAGSMISFDGEQLGPSPLTVAGPCTRRRIDIAHPRYAPTQRFITPKPDDAIDVTLNRPTHNLFIETQPAGAIVSIDGHRAGTTPTMVKIMGFTTIDIAITKPGYKPTTKKLYSKTAADRVSVKLAR
ncbi:MAG TPA: PEGA domain-containing protein [Kofleriaceae bacterium]|nr:PEGA domain-containing protein [Kofleriaceae bacterium]